MRHREDTLRMQRTTGLESAQYPMLCAFTKDIMIILMKLTCMCKCKC